MFGNPSMFGKMVSQLQQDNIDYEMKLMFTSSMRHMLASIASQELLDMEKSKNPAVQSLESSGFVAAMVKTLETTKDDVYIPAYCFQMLSDYVGLVKNTKEFKNTSILDLTIETLRNGLSTHKYYAVSFFQAYCGFEKEFLQSNSEKLFTLVKLSLEVSKMSPQVFIDELNNKNRDDSHLQIDIIYPNESIEYGIAYAPRYALLIQENALSAISGLILTRTLIPEGSIEIMRKVPELLPSMIELLPLPIPEHYPEASNSYLAGEILSILAHRGMNQELHKEALEMILKAGFVETAKKALELLDKEKVVEQVMKKFKVLKEKSRLNITLVPEKIEMTFSQRMKLKVILLGLILSISHYESTARELEPFIPILKQNLNRYQKIEGKKVTPSSLEGRDGNFVGSLDEYISKNRIMEIKKQLHFSPQPIQAILLTFKNLQKHEIQKEPIAGQDVYKKQASKAKKNGNESFKERYFWNSISWYTLALELGPSKEEEYVIYSNRSECYLQVGEYQKALDDAEKALSLDPTHEKSLRRKKRAESRLKK